MVHYVQSIRCVAVALALAGLHSEAPAQVGSQVTTGARPLLRWEELGPAPISGSQYTGRVSAIAASPTRPGVYFIGGADGGVWRTENGGGAWEPVTDDMPTLAIGAIAMAPSDEDVIYAGTGEANYANHSRYGLGILKSTDGGDSWELLGRDVLGGRTISKLAIHPANPDIVYAAVARAGGFPELAGAKGHPGATGPRGVFKTVDGGANWIRLTGGLPDLACTDISMSPSDPNVLIAGTGRIFGAGNNGVYRTADGGSNWTKITSGLSSNVGRISLAFAPSDGARAYALFTRPALATGGGASTQGAYRSNDGGVTWSVLSTLPTMQASYGWYLCVVAVNPTDRNEVMMGGFSLQRSANGGQSWQARTPPHVDLHAVAWDANGRVLAGSDGGIHRSPNGGQSWAARNAGLGLIQLYAGLSSHPTDPEVFYGGFQDNGTALRTDGTGWTQVFGGDGGWTQVDQANPNRVFVEFQGTGQLYRTDGAGFTVTSFGISGGDRNCFLPPYLIEKGDSTRMLYGTHRVYRSVDSGMSWSPISADLTNGGGAIRALAQAPSDPNFVYAATNDGNVLSSTDGGSTFTTRLTAHPGWPRVTNELFVHPRRATTVYLATASFGADQVQRSVDGGASWTSLDGDLPDVPVNVVACVPRGPHQPALLFAGADDGVYASEDDGVHWRRYGKGLPHGVVVDLRVERNRNRMVIATQGRGVWRIPLLLNGPAPR